MHKIVFIAVFLFGALLFANSSVESCELNEEVPNNLFAKVSYWNTKAGESCYEVILNHTCVVKFSRLFVEEPKWYIVRFIKHRVEPYEDPGSYGFFHLYTESNMTNSKFIPFVILSYLSMKQN